MGQRGPYFDAAAAAAVAAVFADEAASAAAVAAVPADIAAEAAAPESAGGVVTTVVEDVTGGVVAGGLTTVSSFLLHAANETAAARVAINKTVFMFLLDFKVRQLPAIAGTLLGRGAPSCARQGKPEHFQCLTHDYRAVRCFP